MFHDPDEASALCTPRDPHSRSQFHLELINSSVRLEELASAGSAMFIVGQVVWRIITVAVQEGYRREIASGGPLVIVGRTLGQYAVINREGMLHSRLIPAHQLMPYYSTWHIARLPADLTCHPQLEDLLCHEYEA